MWDHRGIRGLRLWVASAAVPAVQALLSHHPYQAHYLHRQPRCYLVLQGLVQARQGVPAQQQQQEARCP